LLLVVVVVVVFGDIRPDDAWQDTEHKASVKMGSSEFQRICRDLGQIGDSGG
jgi:hypothetical protein